MSRANSQDGLVFGFSAVSFKRGGQVIGQSQITGSFSAEVSPELVDTVGGAASYPIATRLGRASGDATLTLNERPNFLELELNGATATATAASATPAAGTATNTVGTSVSSGLTITAGTTVTDYMDFEVEATGTAELSVRVTGSNGAQEFESVGISSTAVNIGQTGVQLSGTSPNFTTGDRAIFAVTPAHGGVNVLAVPQVRVANEYEVAFYSARGGDQDSIQIYTFPRVVFRGVNAMLEDMAISAVEIPMKVMAPTDGGSVYTLRKVYPTS